MNDGEKKVLFTTASAQMRYLERMEHKYFMLMMLATRRNFGTAERAHLEAKAALDSFDPIAHDKLVHDRNVAR